MLPEAAVVAPPPAAPRRRLNPFVLPTETNTRFALLILAATALVLSVGAILALPVLMASGSVLTRYAGTLALSAPADLSPAERQQATSAFQQKFNQWAPAFALSCTVPFLLVGLMAGVAYGLYRWHPRQILSQKALTPLERSKDPLLYDTVSNLAQQFWAVPPPTIYLEPQSARADGQAWGFRQAYCLRIGNGVRLLLRKQSEAAKAVLRHELAHIVNGDIAPAYFTQALWKTLVYVALPVWVATFLITYAASGPLFRDIPTEAFTSLETMLQLPAYYSLGPLLAAWTSSPWLALVIALAVVRASVLRSREIYADWRAALWGRGRRLAVRIGQSRRPSTAPVATPLERTSGLARARSNTKNPPSPLLQPDGYFFLPGFFAGLSSLWANDSRALSAIRRLCGVRSHSSLQSVASLYDTGRF